MWWTDRRALPVNKIIALPLWLLLLTAFVYALLLAAAVALSLRTAKRRGSIYGNGSRPQPLPAGQTRPASAADEPGADSFMSLEAAIGEWCRSGKYRLQSYSTADLARDLGVSLKCIQGYFRHIGKDFRSWRNCVRIAKAQSIMLEDRDLPSYIAGQMVGLEKASNFHKQFHTVTGCTVNEWRRKNS